MRTWTLLTAYVTAVLAAPAWSQDDDPAKEYPQIRVHTGAQDPVLLNKGGRILGEYDAHFDLVRALHLWPPGGARDFGDVDGDGHLDEINQLGVFLGHGDGHFGVLTCAFNSGTAVASGDLDGDGRSDVILGTRGLHAYLGNPDGTLTFLRSLGIPFQGGGNLPGLRLVDLDGDGDLDLLGGGVGGPLLAWNKGSAVFERAERSCIYPQRATVCDLNRDGLKELVTIGHDPLAPRDEPQVAVFLYPGVGREALGERMVLPIPGLDKPEREVSSLLGVTAGDVDRDGNEDILCTGPAGFLGLFPGRGDGSLEEPRLLPIPASSRPSALLLEDLDLDGRLDLLAGFTYESRVYWGLSEGFVDFLQPTILRVAYAQRFDVIRPLHRTFIRGDADDDGRLGLADALAILEQLFLLREVACGDAMDADDSGRVNVTDAVYLILHLVSGGPAPPYPYPSPGGDPTMDRSQAGPRQIAGDLGCSPETFRYRDFAPCLTEAPPDPACKNPPRQFLDVSVPD